jgi:DNA primase
MSPVEEIKSKIDTVELVGSYVRLQRAGSNFKACCPFHNEKSPSFVVSPARQMWHCFGCSKGGDIFSFVMEIEGHTFPEALQLLADRAGVVIKKEDPSIRSERNRLYAVLEEATKFFENKLWENPALPLDYLKQRGLNENTIKEFRVGFAPNDWKVLFMHLRQCGFSSIDIERAGLSIRKQGNDYFDRFRGRIMFPVFDYSGRVVAFGGRVYPHRDDVAKYVNSPETPLYQKSKILYGLHSAKSHIVKENSCVIVEGYMDVLMATQAGTKNVVASSGTALTVQQVRMLRRLCEDLIMSFDSDLAGEDAARRGIELALAEGSSVRVIQLEDAKDPAELVLKNIELWKKSVNGAVHVVQFFINGVSSKVTEKPELSRQVERKVLPVVAALSSELEQAHWIKEISTLLGITEEVTWAAFRRIQNRQVVDNKSEGIIDDVSKDSSMRTRKTLLEERILSILAREPNLLDTNVFVLDSSFFSQKYESLFLQIKKERFAGEDFLKNFGSRGMIESELLLESSTDIKEEFLKCQKELKKEHIKERLIFLGDRIRVAETKHDASLPKLLEEFRSLSQNMIQL